MPSKGIGEVSSIRKLKIPLVGNLFNFAKWVPLCPACQVPNTALTEDLCKIVAADRIMSEAQIEALAMESACAYQRRRRLFAKGQSSPDGLDLHQGNKGVG